MHHSNANLQENGVLHTFSVQGYRDRMRSTYRVTYGPPSALTIKDLPIPQPKADELLVRVHASSVSRTDSGVLRGKPFVFRFFAGFPRPRFRATGCDFAGVVEDVGTDVSEFKPGDRVFGFDDTGLGTHAQYATVSVHKAIFTLPENLTFTQAVGCTEGAFYAVNFLNKVKLTNDSRVLVIGGTGAIGSAAIQLLAARGIHVDAVCPQEHGEMVSGLGASKIFDSARTGHLIPCELYDFVFDAVGKSRFKLCKPILAPHGIYISSELGSRGENLVLPLLTKMGRGQRVIFPIPKDPRGSLEKVLELAQTGEFKAVIDQTFSIDEIASAFEYVESGKKIGTVVLDLI